MHFKYIFIDCDAMPDVNSFFTAHSIVFVLTFCFRSIQMPFEFNRFECYLKQT